MKSKVDLNGTILSILTVIFAILSFIVMANNANTIKLERKAIDEALTECRFKNIMLEEKLNAYKNDVKAPTTRIIKGCTDSSFKSWLDYQSITMTSSKQYKLQQEAVTGDYGIRMYKGFYMIALTEMYGEIGDIVAVDFENDSIYAIIAERKEAGHDHCSSERDGSMIEFIIDLEYLDSKVQYDGNFNVIWNGPVVQVINYGQHRKE